MTDFWIWAGEAYGRDGVADACLDLQNRHDQNVPLLLWAAWAAAHSVRIDADVARQVVVIARVWSDEVIVPVRVVRQRLKSALHEGDDAVRLALREKVKATELEAEKALMLQLEALVAPGLLLPLDRGIDACLDGLVMVFRAWSPDRDPQSLAKLHQALTKG